MLMHESLRRYLVTELDSYIGEHWKPGVRRIHVEAARRLRECAEELAERFEDRYPFDESDAPLWVDPLRLAWLEFIACGSGHRMYHDVPKAHAEKVKAGKLRHPAKSSAAGTLSPALVASRIKANGGKLSKALRRDLWREFGASDSALFRLRKQAIALNLLP